MEWATTVPSLKSICRQLIRSQLGHMVHHKLTRLPLPSTIIAYLQFSDLDDIDIEMIDLNESIRKEALMSRPSPCGLRSLQGTLSYDVLAAQEH